MEITKKTHRGICDIVCADGRRLVSYQEVTSYDDWRETPIGPMNFGRIHMGPWRYVIEHPDGRQQPTTQEAFIAMETMRKPEPVSPKPGYLRLFSSIAE